METRRWVNRSQPDTMQIAVWLLYFRGIITLLFGPDQQVDVVFSDSALLQIGLGVGLGAAAYGIANDRRWGYYLGVAMASVPLIGRLLLAFGISFRFDVPSVSPFDYDVLGLLFEAALVALLLHPKSREHQRIWFR